MIRPHVFYGDNEESVSDVFRHGNPLLTITSIAVLGLYGLVWNSRSPSLLEQRLWRVATVTAVVCWLALSLLQFAEARLQRERTNISKPELTLVERMLCSLRKRAKHLSIFLWAISRMYLVVGAFLSIRVMSADVYTSTKWGSFISDL